MKLCANITNDVEFSCPDEIDQSEPHHNDNIHKRETSYKGKYLVNTDEVFEFKKYTVDAKMIVRNGNTYIVLAGSKIDTNIYSNTENVKRLREINKDNMSVDTVIKDTEFNSPPSAGQFVCGGACNGKIYWRTKEGTPLEHFIEYI